ncbi:MAG: ROK family protein [Deltaproteobacteria bacterium]|nr:ROK family protein [Deltaproteobacteria bacterium]
MIKPHRIGIDLGGTKIESILLNPPGDELYRKRIPTPGKQIARYEGVLDAIVNLVHETAKRISDADIFTVGLGIPGTLNSRTGLVQNANLTCLTGRPLKADLEEKLGRPVAMDNDANCFTLAESKAGAGRGYGLVFGIIMGTGCGGGLCMEGRVLQGQHGIAGEWGHFSIDPLGERCYCGNKGCVETKISGTGVSRAFFKDYGKHLTMQQITEGYRNGDMQCVHAFERFLDDFGRSLGGLISILDPDAVVIGGGLSNIEELYTLGLEQARRYAFHERIETPILKNILGDSAGVLGAAWLGM